jgi:hypothetical protein
MSAIFEQMSSIFGKMDSSIFGKMRETMKDLFSAGEQSNYKLPNIICIGGESSGKSSLLENITKCKLFPRDMKMCTKCPIHLILNGNKQYFSVSIEGIEYKYNDNNEVYEKILSYMKSLPSDKISESEITVTIIDKNLPSIEFYDLPGLRAYPPCEAAKSVAITRKYLNDKNAIIICAVPATDTRLTACQSIALIIELNLQKNSIIALTMCDRVQYDYIQELIIDRILGTSPEVIELKFAGYVGIINRSHKDKISLNDNGIFENSWFQKNVIEYAMDDLVELTDSDIDIIRNHLEIDNLLKYIDEIYSKYIKSDWVPKISAVIENKILNETIKLSELGELYTKEQLETIMNKEGLNWVNFNTICGTDNFNNITYDIAMLDINLNRCNNQSEINKLNTFASKFGNNIDIGDAKIDISDSDYFYNSVDIFNNCDYKVIAHDFHICRSIQDYVGYENRNNIDKNITACALFILAARASIACNIAIIKPYNKNNDKYTLIRSIEPRIRTLLIRTADAVNKSNSTNESNSEIARKIYDDIQQLSIWYANNEAIDVDNWVKSIINCETIGVFTGKVLIKINDDHSKEQIHRYSDLLNSYREQLTLHLAKFKTDKCESLISKIKDAFQLNSVLGLKNSSSDISKRYLMITYGEHIKSFKFEISDDDLVENEETHAIRQSLTNNNDKYSKHLQKIETLMFV